MVKRLKKISIYPVGDHWRVDYYDEKRVRRRPKFKLKSEALALKKSLEIKFLGLEEYVAVEEKISDAIRRYAEVFSAKKESLKLEKHYFEQLYKFLRDNQVYYMAEIRLEHLEKLQVFLLKTDKPSTVNRKFNTYRHFFSRCVRWGLIAKNPSEHLDNLKAEPNPKKVWPYDIEKKILSCCPPYVAEVLKFIAATGFAPIEVHNLNFGDLDFERKTLVGKRRKGGRGLIEKHVPMSQEVYSLLMQARERARLKFRAKDSDPVFVNSKGKRIVPQIFAKAVRKACAKAGVQGYSAYGLRHRFLTNLAIANVGHEKIRLLGGHRSLKTTEQYLHLNVDNLRDAVEIASAKRGGS